MDIKNEITQYKKVLNKRHNEAKKNKNWVDESYYRGRIDSLEYIMLLIMGKTI